MAWPEVVVVHPSRLFSEALGNILDTARFKLVSAVTDADCIPFEALSDSTLFVVGGGNPRQMASTIRTIKQQLDSALIAVIGDPNESEIAMAFEAGANGYLRESMTPQTMLMALERLLHEETVLPPVLPKFSPPSLARETGLTVDDSGAMDWHAATFQPQKRINMKELHLSERQAAILQALSDGTPNKVIAQHLHISEATVKLHVKAVLRKIQVKNRTQAAVWAVKNPAAGNKES